MSVTTITVPDTTEQESTALACVAEARALQVVDQATFDAAGSMIKRGADIKRGIVASIAPAKKAAHEAHKAITALEAKLVAPIDEARSIIEPKAVAWQRAETARREAEARAAAEVERKRLEAIRAAELEAAELARKEAEERALHLATEAQERGDDDAAEAVLRAAEAADAAAQAQKAAIVAAPVYVAPLAVEKIKTDGVATVKTWSAEVTDLVALARYVSMNPHMVGLIEANMPALNAQARSLKNLMQIPGVRAVETESMRSKR